MSSRVDSTLILGQAIGFADKPPEVWLHSCASTIYAHRFDAGNAVITCILGGVAKKWGQSIAIAKIWPRRGHRTYRATTHMNPG